MRGVSCILLETSRGWRLLAAGTDARSCAYGGDANASPAELAEWVRQSVSEHQLNGRQLLLAPDTASTFFATFAASKLGAARDRNSLTYQLEDTLPFDAEEIVADFQAGPVTVSGVCIELKRWAPIVEALEGAGLLVQSIVPASLLACQSLLQEPAAQEADLVLWPREEDCDLFCIRDQQVVRWRRCRRERQALARELSGELLDLEHPASIALVNAAEDVQETLRCLESADAVSLTTDAWDVHVARAGAEVLRARWQPWYELRRGLLTNGDPARPYRGALYWLCGAAPLFLVSLAVACWWRGEQLARQLVEVNQNQNEVFLQAFPETSIPLAVLARLRSEHTKVTGSRRTGDDVTRPRSALQVLHALLAGLPDDIRFRLTEIRIEDGALTFDVVLKSHSDAGRLAASLEAHGFAVLPPATTQAEDQTIQSRVQAVWSSQPAPMERSSNDGGRSDNEIPGGQP